MSELPIYGAAELPSRREALFLAFREKFGSLPDRLFSSPGRAEIVGNHTDHNLGKVLVGALSCDILAAVKKRDDGVVEICADQFPPVSLSVRDLGLREREKGRSVSLVRGVLRYLADRGCSFGGFSAYTHSTVFRGAGVSSSAAFEVLVAEIVNRLYLGGALPPIEKAFAGQYAENTYYGKPCGLLDQSGIAFGGLNQMDFGGGRIALEGVPAPVGYRLVLTNTGGSHASLSSHYAEIRREMSEVAAFFRKNVLRELTEEDLLRALPLLRKSLSDRAILRAFHFFEENERVDRAAVALKQGNVSLFFEQVRKSGESSLAFLQNCYLPGDTAQPIVLAMKLSEKLLKDGAFRMMGGGFAGTVLAFCREGEERAYGREMARVFGKENVHYTELRESGCCELEV